MDPVSVIALTNASLGIARSLVHTVKDLYELAEAYETAALGIRTVATQCNSFRIAVQRINTWLNTQNESTRHNLDDDFWQALADNLETGRLVLEDLEKRIKGLKKNPAKFWTRTKYLWNSVVISELQSQIQGLMAAVSILIQVIDIPTTGGRRSQSLAQRSRLNNLTKSVRMTVEERREKVRKSQEQNLLDDVDSEPNPGALQEALPVSNTDAILPDSAPPPYEYFGGELKQTTSSDLLTFSDIKKSPEVASTETRMSARVSDPPPEAKDEKSKRPKWNLKFRKRSSTPKDEPLLRNLSNTALNASSGPEKPTSPPSDNRGSSAELTSLVDDKARQLAETPAPIEPHVAGNEYFDLQQAMMGMSMPMAAQTPFGSDLLDRNDSAVETGQVSNNLALGDIRASESKISSIFTPPAEKNASPVQLSTLPDIAALDETVPSGPLDREPLVSTSTSDNSLSKTQSGPAPPTATATQSHDLPRTKSTDNTNTNTKTPNPNPSSPPIATYTSPKQQAFHRIRPSQRVREARERSHSSGPKRDLPTIPDAPVRQTSSMTLSSLTPTHQTWRTASVLAPQSLSLSLSNSNTLRLKISFDPSTFTSRISAPAARALNLLDAALAASVDHVPIATLTLLYTVDDGTSRSVMGDELELEVMHDEESRSLEIRFAADQIMLRDVMDAAGELYWSERAVPRGLRTVESLRLFRRFELWRW